MDDVTWTADIAAAPAPSAHTVVTRRQATDLVTLVEYSRGSITARYWSKPTANMANTEVCTTRLKQVGEFI